ncbi:ABC transporter substrate-binding protein [Leifsonia poae]|uniref:Peptide ABC transporter substrate-binding protein n=1 Tax=Leifsonia poae TaxID=110933 RepID=A0A9W6HD71_9MICO|nr:ABC transporter substrate-binding protein [Leifsonia poae]GLJ77996.1 peptide ABC transporter substrate-binding protein [Leifsonia poae]
MRSAHISGKRLLAVSAALAATALVLAGCSGNANNTGSGSSGSLTVGTTDKITSIDPAGSYDNGSFAVMNQVYPFLMNSPYGSADVKPDIAESAEFTSPNEYTVKLKPGLKFANGHDLTSSDVKFTFDRQKKINDPNGPAYLLANIDTVEATDPTTVVFHLKVPNDQTFAQVLSSPAGPIVDEQVFSADKVTPDNTIVKGHAFAGQYDITSYDFNNLIAYKAYSGYKGLLGKPATDKINVKYYTEASNMKLDIQKGGIDVAFRSLSATDIASLRTDKNVKVVDGPGGEIRYIVFNFNTMPYGAKTTQADPKKALAVRQAAADLVDRAAIAKQVYKDTYTPLYSFVPSGLTGATTVLKDLYGDGNGGPSLDKAKAALQAAGVSTPVALNLQYNTDHYGPSSSDEYAQVKDQLEQGGLFKVNLQSTEYVQYSKDRVKDTYPAYQLGWFPDYSDADNYLTPFFAKDNFLVNHYDNPEVQKLIDQQLGTTDKAARTKLIEEIQAKVGADLSTLPLLQGAQVAITGKTVSGADKTLDGSFKFRYAALSKG